MSVKVITPDIPEAKTYFSWGDKLWYIFDVTIDGEMALVEDCVTERVQWLKVALFRKGMKEVKLVPNVGDSDS